MMKNRSFIAKMVIVFFFFSSCNKTETAATNNIIPTDPVVNNYNYYTITNNGIPPGKSEIVFALNSKNDGKIFLVDERGSVIKEKSTGTDVQNLQKWVIDGEIRYTYFKSDGKILLDSIQGTELGYNYICDSGLNILDTVKLLSFGNIDAGTQDKLDVHEFILLGDHHYIAETYRRETPDNIPEDLQPATGVKVVACIIQEVDNGVVVFQWDGTKFPEFYLSSKENNGFSNAKKTLDYMHLNSISIDSTDNNLIVSFRNLNEIVKLNRQTGEIMWRLGGSNSDFNLTGDQLFLRQHYAHIIEGGKTLIFVDNGLAGTRNTSRILEFQLDEINKTISSFNSFPVPDRFIQFAGSVQKNGDEYFIGGGSGNYALRVNYKTNNILLRLNMKYPSYRALQYQK